MSRFEDELSALINRECMEDGSNTPDFILAQYLSKCLESFNAAVVLRETWYGRQVLPPHAAPRRDDIGTNAAAPPDDLKRCAVCGWPRSDTPAGCRPGDCGMRPPPSIMFAPDRAKAERAALNERLGQNLNKGAE